MLRLAWATTWGRPIGKHPSRLLGIGYGIGAPPKKPGNNRRGCLLSLTAGTVVLHPLPKLTRRTGGVPGSDTWIALLINVCFLHLY